MRQIAFLFCAACFGLISAAALADPKEDSLAGIARCPKNLDDRTYLDCLYGAVQPLRASLGLPPAPAAQQRLVPGPVVSPGPAPAAAQPRDSGFLAHMTGASSDLRMSAYSFDKRGFITVTFTNGEVWQQLPNDTSFAQLGARAANYAVFLTAEEGGTSRMNIKGEPGSFAMRRIR